MKLMTRLAAPLACLLSLAVLAPTPMAAPAQRASRAPADVPWLYRGSDVPQDREWVFGELANGLRYAVRKNGVPPGQVSIRVRVDAGSLNERENERGYAHLLEHLVFRQSRYLGDGEAIPTWQRLGATFGSDTNAETTSTHTVFKIDLPNATPVALEESFRLLSGMVAEPTLSEANVRTDVPIVLAEMRERAGAGNRVADATRELYYAGQPLAERPVIGTVATLEAAGEASVRAFHARWYRPENVTVIVAGDIDPVRLELLVKKWFGTWTPAGRPAPAPSFGDPQAPRGADPANPVGETRVMVEPDLPRGVTYAILRPWRPVNDTIVYNQGLMTDALAQAIINRRLEARARSGGSFLVAQVNQEDVSRSADGTFVSVAPLGADWRKALSDVRAVIADAIATPPSQEEIDREVAEMRVAFQVGVEQRRLLPGSKVADDLVNAIDIRETVAAPEAVLEIFEATVPLFTPAAVAERTRKLFSGTVTRAMLLTPNAGEGDAEALRAAMLAPVTPDGTARLDSSPIRFEDMPAIGTPAKPTSINGIGMLGIDRVEFANGVRALIWPLAEEPGRVTVKVRFGAGYRAFASGDAPYITLGQFALVGSGVGDLGEEQLDRISTGRRLGFEFSIGEAAFTFAAETRPADLADQLYLLAAKFAMPRWDVNPVMRARAAAGIQYEAYATSPQGVLQRDLAYYQRDRDPRFHTPTPQEIEAATPEGFRQVWQPILENGPIEIQIFGDFNKMEALGVLERTFGALSVRPPLPDSTQPATARFPAPVADPVTLYHRGDANQAAAVISWPTGGGMAGVSESRQLEILTQVFSNRLLDAVREKMGASYAPQVSSSWPLELSDGGAITAAAQVHPDAVPVFLATAREIAADLAARPPSADELARVIEPLRQQITRATASTGFFMWQLEGATTDPARIAAMRTFLPDHTQTTPQRMQELAARYLRGDRTWSLVVLPQQGQGELGRAPASAPASAPAPAAGR